MHKKKGMCVMKEICTEALKYTPKALSQQIKAVAWGHGDKKKIKLKEGNL